MSAKSVVPGVYTISLGMVNAFLLDCEELVLIDAGVAGSETRILSAVRGIGRQPQDLKHILITHHHSDHVGGLLALQQATGAQVYMHEQDAAAYRKGVLIRRVESSGGLFSRLAVASINREIARQSSQTAPPAHARVDHRLTGGETLPLAGGLRVLHTPGHTSGHVAFLWPQQGGVLFAGDLASHMTGLGYSILYEDFAGGRRTLRELGDLEFEVACFAHGGPILSGAAEQFRRKFGAK